MKTKHHRVPRRWKLDRVGFFNHQSSMPTNIIMIEDIEHRAWNILTKNSAMSLAETVASLNRFIPHNVRFQIVKR